MTEPTVPVEIPSERENGRFGPTVAVGTDGERSATEASMAITYRKLAHIATWSQDRSLAPILDEHGLFMPQWRQNILLLDQGFHPKSRRAFPGVDAYVDWFRLTFRVAGGRAWRR